MGLPGPAGPAGVQAPPGADGFGSLYFVRSLDMVRL